MGRLNMQLARQTVQWVSRSTGKPCWSHTRRLNCATVDDAFPTFPTQKEKKKKKKRYIPVDTGEDK